MEALDSTTDPFGGVIPTPEALPTAPKEFGRRLRQSLTAWSAEGFKVVWLELHIARASLISVAVEAGFSFHHSGDDYLMMTHQLIESAIVPAYASHYIGVGGVVVNGDNQLLVVREKRGGPSRPSSYKLPGGAVHAGEHLTDGVVREVLEETGIRTRFDALVCLRNLHGYRHGKSDIYFVCRLEPLSKQIFIQAEEIEECLWMPLDQYLSSESVNPFNKRIVRASMESPGVVPTSIDGHRDPDQVEIFMPSSGQ